ncbi:SPEN protein [Balamuthia mandrillaris]
MQEEKNNLEASTGTPNINFFEEAQKSISFLLQTDTVPKFLSSSDYKTVKELREVEHKLPNLLGTLAALKEEIEKVETEVDHFSNKKEMLEEYVRNSVAEADRMLKERNDQLEEMEKERVRREKEAEKERLKKEKEAEKERLKKEREERKKEGGGGGVFQDSIMGSMGLANLGPPRPKKKEHKIKLGEDSYIFYVDVLQAKDLVARDQSGKPTKANAYITVRVGRHKETTKVVMNSNNPKWYESFIFVLKPGEPQKVKVEAVQYNVMGKPTPIGVLQFPAAKSFSEQGGGVKQLHWFSFEAAVEGAPPGEGKLQLSLDYHRVLGKKEETECEISKVQQLIASLEGESADSKKKGKISSGDKKLVKILKQKESKLQKSLATM